MKLYFDFLREGDFQKIPLSVTLPKTIIKVFKREFEELEMLNEK